MYVYIYIHTYISVYIYICKMWIEKLRHLEVGFSD